MYFNTSTLWKTASLDYARLKWLFLSHLPNMQVFFGPLYKKKNQVEKKICFLAKLSPIFVKPVISLKIGISLTNKRIFKQTVFELSLKWSNILVQNDYH